MERRTTKKKFCIMRGKIINYRETKDYVCCPRIVIKDVCCERGKSREDMEDWKIQATSIVVTHNTDFVVDRNVKGENRWKYGKHRFTLGKKYCSQ